MITGWTNIPANKEVLDMLELYLAFIEEEQPRFQAFLEYYGVEDKDTIPVSDFQETVNECRKELIQ